MAGGKPLFAPGNDSGMGMVVLRIHIHLQAVASEIRGTGNTRMGILLTHTLNLQTHKCNII
jgi:hypothetical protein